MIDNMEKTLPIFRLMSGQGEEYLPLLRSATLEVEGRLKPDADKDDERLPFLIAAIANLYYVQLDSAKLKPYAAAVGDLSARTGGEYRATAAGELVERFTTSCADLLLYKDSGFYFCTTGKAPEISTERS